MVVGGGWVVVGVGWVVVGAGSVVGAVVSAAVVVGASVVVGAAVVSGAAVVMGATVVVESASSSPDEQALTSKTALMVVAKMRRVVSRIRTAWPIRPARATGTCPHGRPTEPNLEGDDTCGADLPASNPTWCPDVLGPPCLL